MLFNIRIIQHKIKRSWDLIRNLIRSSTLFIHGSYTKWPEYILIKMNPITRYNFLNYFFHIIEDYISDIYVKTSTNDVVLRQPRYPL